VGKKTVFITKYALTKGILERELVMQHDERIVEVVWPGGLNGTARFYEDWHWTKGAAQARAYEMKRRKIAQLKEHIRKMEKKEF